jgi:fructosamine-3-kinase
VSAPRALLDAVAAGLGEPVRSSSPVTGAGSINDAWRIELDSGRVAFVKSRADAADAEFAAEGAGLEWLAQAAAVRVPEVLGHGERPGWLGLEWVDSGSLTREGWEELGRGLATIHRAGASAHGAMPPGSPDRVLRIGSVELDAGEAESWAEVYADYRLRPLLAMATERRTIDPGDAVAIGRVCERLDVLAGPSEPPARLHGDLWTGNVYADASGRPWLIDPAAHGGHREIDLAMLRLFGGAGGRWLAAYEEAYPLAEGHSERVELWQILPLLVHAVLFGGGYGASAGAAARRYI